MKKSKRILIILAFIVLLGLIYMPNKAFAAEDGEVVSINIGANAGDSVSSVNLYLEDHETEQLKTTIKVWKNDEIVEDNSIQANWSSSDESVVTVSSTGLLTAKKEGKATITATAGDEKESIEVNVKPAPTYADLSDVKYEWTEDWKRGSLYLISENATKWQNELSGRSLYAIITKDNTKPEVILEKGGNIDSDYIQNNQEICIIYNNGNNDNIKYTIDMSKYLELNQDIYLWLISEEYISRDVGNGYYGEDGSFRGFSSKFVISGEKIEKGKNPTYSGLFWAAHLTHDHIQLPFNLPRDRNGSQRNFNLKIGKITDNNILNNIKNENKDGFSQLEVYAKANNPVFEGKLMTNRDDCTLRI